jgi:hypothetical protein
VSERIEFRSCEEEDEPTVRALLASSSLPVDDVAADRQEYLPGTAAGTAACSDASRNPPPTAGRTLLKGISSSSPREKPRTRRDPSSSRDRTTEGPSPARPQGSRSSPSPFMGWPSRLLPRPPEAARPPHLSPAKLHCAFCRAASRWSASASRYLSATARAGSRSLSGRSDSATSQASVSAWSSWRCSSAARPAEPSAGRPPSGPRRWPPCRSPAPPCLGNPPAAGSRAESAGEASGRAPSAGGVERSPLLPCPPPRCAAPSRSRISTSCRCRAASRSSSCLTRPSSSPRLPRRAMTAAIDDRGSGLGAGRGAAPRAATKASLTKGAGINTGAPVVRAEVKSRG